MHDDEIRRLLGDARETPRSNAGAWRDSLLRRFGRGDAPTSPAAGSTGPDRRQFLRLGGTAVLGAAALAACGSDEESKPSETGVTEPAPAETTLAPPQTTSPEEGADNDLVVLRTAVSMELVAVAFYGLLSPDEDETPSADLALPGTIRFDDDVIAAATLLRANHRAHAEALSEIVSELGGDRVTQPNGAILATLVTPELEDLTTQRTVLLFSRSLEEVGAATYGWAGGVLSTPELRQTIMGVGAASARHTSVLSLLIDPSGADAVPNAFLDVSGPARLGEDGFLAADQDGDDLTGEPDEGGETEGGGGESGAGSEGGEGEGGSGGEGDTQEGGSGGEGDTQEGDSGGESDGGESGSGSGSEGEGGTNGGPESSGSGEGSG